MNWPAPEKPPLGCKPRMLWVELRIIALAEAIARGAHSGDPERLAFWAKELLDHTEWLSAQ